MKSCSKKRNRMKIIKHCQKYFPKNQFFKEELITTTPKTKKNSSGKLFINILCIFSIFLLAFSIFTFVQNIVAKNGILSPPPTAESEVKLECRLQKCYESPEHAQIEDRLRRNWCSKLLFYIPLCLLYLFSRTEIKFFKKVLK